MVKKIFKIISKIFKVVMVCVIVLFTCVILLQRFSNSSFSFLGYRVFAVVTGSMEPVYSVGDVLLSKSIDADKLKVGDDVTYLGKEGSFKDRVVTHRIIKIEDKDGKKIIRTKGVANNGSDPPIEASQIYGKVSRKLVVLSLLHKYSSSSLGFFLFVIIPIMLLVGSEIVQTMLERRAKQVGGVSGSQTAQANVNVNNPQPGVSAEQLQQQLASLQQQLLAQQNQYVNSSEEQTSIINQQVNPVQNPTVQNNVPVSEQVPTQQVVTNQAPVNDGQSANNNNQLNN